MGINIRTTSFKIFKLQDYVLFICLFLCTYAKSGLWYKITFFSSTLKSFGPDVLAFILAFYLYLYSISRKYKIRNKVIYIATLVTASYSVIKLIETIDLVGMREAFTIYRINYISLISLLLLYRYISNMKYDTISHMFELMKKWLIPIFIIYILQCAGIPVFSRAQVETVANISVNRSIAGIPPVIPVLFAYCIVCLLERKSHKNILYAGICLAVPFMSFTRSLLASAFMILVISVLLYVHKRGMRDNFKLVLYSVCALAATALLAPKTLSYWEALVESTYNYQLKENVGTYAFRERLIQHAVDVNESTGAELVGQGYIRDSKKGEYSLVLGSDTFIAPIIWCEGYLGLIFRVSISLSLLLIAYFYHYRSKNKERQLLGIIVISVVLVQIPNYVQTGIVMQFGYTVPLLYMLIVQASLLMKQESNLYKKI